MSIWTSRPITFVAALYGAAIASLCAPALAAVDRHAAPHMELPTTLPVVEDSVVIAAPVGFCIDHLGSVTQTRDAFVLLAPCRSIAGDPGAPEPAQTGLLTASVLGRASVGSLPEIDQLGAYFASPKGRAVLSRTGNASALTVSESYVSGGAFYVHAIEGDAAGVIGAQSWRAFFEVNGCVVTATLRDLDGHPISSTGGFSVVEHFVDRIVAASPAD